MDILGFITWGANHEAFELFGRSFRWYSILFVSGLWAAYFTIGRIFKKDGIPTEVLQKLWVIGVIGAVIGARLGEVLFYNPQHYFAHPEEILMIWRGGLSSHGTTFTLLVITYLFAKWEMKVPFFTLGDKVVAGIAIAAAFVRFGNFMNSEILGHPSQLPWSVIFSTVDNIPRHPIQLYEGFAYIILSVVLFWGYMRTSSPQKSGFWSGIFMVGMFGTRFFLEFFKENMSTLTEGFPLTMGQVLSLPLAIWGVYLVWQGRK